MLKVPVINKEGKKVEELELNSQIFESEINSHAVHQTIRAILAARRRGTSSTKTRSEVRGGGKKPWRQKGTGRARTGSTRSPLWKGGGVTFGPHPRDYNIKIPRKVKKLALKSALSAKAKESEVIVVDSFEIEEAKTQKAREILDKIGLIDKTVIVLDTESEQAMKALRNIDNVRLVRVPALNVYDVLDNQKLVFTRSAINKVMEALA